jgi:hypothetical protein
MLHRITAHPFTLRTRGNEVRRAVAGS